MVIYICISLCTTFYLSMLFWKLNQSWVKLSSILRYLLQKTEWKYSISLQWWISSTPVDSLWLKDTIWRQGSRSALTQIVVCCLMAPICCLSWCWLGTIICSICSTVLQQIQKAYFVIIIITNYNYFYYYFYYHYYYHYYHYYYHSHYHCYHQLIDLFYSY